MRVTVIGAGIGGLALAQGLHRAGVDVVVHDRDVRTLSEQSFDVSAEALFVGRVPLRRLLTEGLTDRVRFGVSYRDHEVRADGRVITHFDDGSTDVGDVLVGADGARSRVAATLAGRPTSARCGYGCIAARVPLDAATRDRLSHPLASGAVRVGLPALAAWHRLRESAVGTRRTATALSSNVRVVA